MKTNASHHGALGALSCLLALLLPACSGDAGSSTPEAGIDGSPVRFAFDGSFDANLHPSLSQEPGPKAGTSWVPGVRGKALRFDGNGAELKIGGVGALPFGNTITLEAWIRPEGHNPVRRSSSYVFAAHTSTFYVAYNAFDNRVQARVTTKQGKARLLGAKNAVQLEEWQHVALVYDGSQATLYLNGEVTAEAPLTGELDMKAKLGFGIGTWFRTNQAFFGAIDELELHAAALSAAEIRLRAKRPQAAPGK